MDSLDDAERTPAGDGIAPATSADLTALMNRVAQGDRRAFATLYAATSGKMFGVLVRILGRGPAAEDALQEVFVKVWERGRDFDGAKGSVIGWMATIARNRALDDIRRAKTSGAVAFSEDFEPVAETEHPLDGRERGEALARLMKCLDGLDDEKREIILLAYYRGVTREALAGRFGRPVPTIKTWLHRGLAQLRECLSS